VRRGGRVPLRFVASFTAARQLRRRIRARWSAGVRRTRRQANRAPPRTTCHRVGVAQRARITSRRRPPAVRGWAWARTSPNASSGGARPSSSHRRRARTYSCRRSPDLRDRTCKVLIRARALLSDFKDLWNGHRNSPRQVHIDSGRAAHVDRMHPQPLSRLLTIARLAILGPRRGGTNVARRAIVLCTSATGRRQCTLGIDVAKL